MKRVIILKMIFNRFLFVLASKNEAKIEFLGHLFENVNFAQIVLSLELRHKRWHLASLHQFTFRIATPVAFLLAEEAGVFGLEQHESLFLARLIVQMIGVTLFFLIWTLKFLLSAHVLTIAKKNPARWKGYQNRCFSYFQF